MLLRDVIEVTMSEMLIFVNVNEVDFDITDSKPSKICDGEKHLAVEADGIFPDGIPFEPEYDTLEVVEMATKIYQKDGTEVSVLEVSVLEVYVA